MFAEIKLIFAVLLAGISIFSFLLSLFFLFRHRKDGFTTKKGLYRSTLLILLFWISSMIALFLIKEDPKALPGMICFSIFILVAILIDFGKNMLLISVMDKENLRKTLSQRLMQPGGKKNDKS